MPIQNRYLTLQDRKGIERLLNTGESITNIAAMLNRGRATVQKEVSGNGGPAQYNAEKAHQEALQRKLLRNEKRSISLSKGPNPSTRLKTRIEALEMQVEILFDAIKSLKQNKT